MKGIKLVFLILVLTLGITLHLHANEGEIIACQKDKSTGIVSCDDGTAMKPKIDESKKSPRKRWPPMGLNGQSGKVREIDEDEADGKLRSFNPKVIKRKTEQ